MAKQNPKRNKTLNIRVSPWIEYENKELNEILAEKSSEKTEPNDNSKSIGAMNIRRKSLLSSIKMGRNKKPTETKPQDSQSFTQETSLTRNQPRNEMDNSTEVTCISCFGRF